MSYTMLWPSGSNCWSHQHHSWLSRPELFSSDTNLKETSSISKYLAAFWIFLRSALGVWNTPGPFFKVLKTIENNGKKYYQKYYCCSICRSCQMEGFIWSKCHVQDARKVPPQSVTDHPFLLPSTTMCNHYAILPLQANTLSSKAGENCVLFRNTS